MPIRTIAILGGSGFVGRHLAAHLHDAGHHVLILSRRPERARDSLVLPRVKARRLDHFDEASLAEGLRGCDTVVNLVGLLNQNRRERFQGIHVQLARTLVHACHAVGVERMLHMSALNADAGGGASVYLRSKGEAENIAHTTGKPAIAVTSFRPSVIFGPDDSFFNRFARLLALSPIMPLACPRARFAPVYVEDVARAMALSLDDPDSIGKRFELCGPRSYTLEEIVRFSARCTGARTWIKPLGPVGSWLQAALLGLLPGKPFSLDNYRSMSQDSVCTNNGFSHFGITPAGIEGIVPRYLCQGRERDRFNDLRGHARR